MSPTPLQNPEQLNKGPNPLGTLVGQYRDIARAPNASVQGGSISLGCMDGDTQLNYWVAHDVGRGARLDDPSEAWIVRTVKVPHGTPSEGHTPLSVHELADTYEDLFVVRYGSPLVLRKVMTKPADLNSRDGLVVASPQEVGDVLTELRPLLQRERERRERFKAGQKPQGWLGALGLRR
jgi:hypothetical protein